jgi:hypothetical protein
MYDLRSPEKLWLPGKVGGDPGFIAEKEEGQIRVLLKGERCSRDNDCRAFIPAHGIERYGA